MVPVYPVAILQIDCALVAAMLVDKVRESFPDCLG
jgi:hypothetical protein